MTSPETTGGLTDLQLLLQSMAPEIAKEAYVFLSFPPGSLPSGLTSIGTFLEREGTTVICTTNEASKHALPCGNRFKRITLNVHSSLTAVGFLSAVSKVLANAGISCNVVSAYYHDHLFVPEHSADQALCALQELITLHST